jgi:hypothetical protein
MESIARVARFKTEGISIGSRSAPFVVGIILEPEKPRLLQNASAIGGHCQSVSETIPDQHFAANRS